MRASFPLCLLSQDFFTGFGPIAKIIVHMLYLGNSLPLATGKCEGGQHINEKRDHMLGGNTLFFVATGEACKGTSWAIFHSFYVTRGPVGTF